MTDKSVASLIPKTIHQIYGIFDDGIKLDQIDVFRESVDETKRFCDEYKYEYKMWNLKDCEEFICEYFPQYICLWNEFRYPIQRADFIRYCILFIHGGFYVDCDVYPIQNLDSLLDSGRQVFTSWNDDKDKKPYNAVMGSVKRNPLFLDIMDDIQNRVIEKQSKKIYDTWKGRLVFQTTGHHMLKRHVPKENIYDLMLIYNEKKNIYTTSPNPYFYDNNISFWHHE